MGNSAPSGGIYNDMVIHGQERDPRYGNVTFLHDRSDPKKLYMNKKLWTDASDDYALINDVIQLRRGVSHPNLAALVDFNQGNDHYSTTSFNKFQPTWEYFDNNLERDIANNPSGIYQTGNQGYSEEKIFYILNSIINADMTLKNEAKFYHGNIQPSTVLLDPDQRVKMIDDRLVHPTNNLYTRMLFDSHTKGALSPNLMKKLKAGEVNPKYDQSREDSWQLGMVGLCLANSKKLDDYYDWENREVRIGDIENDLQNLEGRYSAPFVKFLRNSLQDDETQRMPMEAQQEFLQGFQTAINDFKLNFNARGPKPFTTQKIEKKVIINANVQPNLYNNAIVFGNNNDFFSGPSQEVYVQSTPDQLIPAEGDFFKNVETIEAPPVYETQILPPGQSIEYLQ